MGDSRQSNHSLFRCALFGGADESFLDVNLVYQAGILIEPLDVPLDQQGLNGKFLTEAVLAGFMPWANHPLQLTPKP